MASRAPPATPVAIPTVIVGKLSSVNCMCPLLEVGRGRVVDKTSAIEVSWSSSVFTGVLREDVLLVGDSLALVVTVTKGRETDDICLAVEI